MALTWWVTYLRGVGGVGGDSHRIQTCNLLIRSQMLYSVELANRLY